MKDCKYSIPIVLVGMLIFTLICNSRIDVPSELLLAFLALLHAGMIWIVVTILRDSAPPSRDQSAKEIGFNDRLTTGNDLESKLSA